MKTTSRAFDHFPPSDDLFALVQLRQYCAFIQFRCLSAQWNFPHEHLVIGSGPRQAFDRSDEEIATLLTAACEHYRDTRSPETVVLSTYAVDRVGPDLLAVKAVYTNPYQAARERSLSSRSA